MMRNDALGGMNKRGGGCKVNAGGVENRQRSTVGDCKMLWGGGWRGWGGFRDHDTAWDVQPDRKLIDGRSQSERNERARVQARRKSDKGDAQCCHSSVKDFSPLVTFENGQQGFLLQSSLSCLPQIVLQQNLSAAVYSQIYNAQALPSEVSK